LEGRKPTQDESTSPDLFSENIVDSISALLDSPNSVQSRSPQKELHQDTLDLASTLVTSPETSSQDIPQEDINSENLSPIGKAQENLVITPEQEDSHDAPEAIISPVDTGKPPELLPEVPQTPAEASNTFRFRMSVTRTPARTTPIRNRLRPRGDDYRGGSPKPFSVKQKITERPLTLIKELHLPPVNFQLPTTVPKPWLALASTTSSVEAYVDAPLFTVGSSTVSPPHQPMHTSPAAEVFTSVPAEAMDSGDSVFPDMQIDSPAERPSHSRRLSAQGRLFSKEAKYYFCNS
ncbi:unnamed protein product, partial [Allacma fusca]